MDTIDFEEEFDSYLHGWYLNSENIMGDYSEEIKHQFKTFMIPIMQKLVNYIIYRKDSILNNIPHPFDTIVRDFIRQVPDWLKEYDSDGDSYKKDVDKEELTAVERFVLYKDYNDNIQDLIFRILDRIISFLQSYLFRLNLLDPRDLCYITEEHGINLFRQISSCIYYHSDETISIKDAAILDFTSIRLMVPSFIHTTFNTNTTNFIKKFLESDVDEKYLLPEMIEYVDKLKARDLYGEIAKYAEENKKKSYDFWLESELENKKQCEKFAEDILVLKGELAKCLKEDPKSKIDNLTLLINEEQKKPSSIRSISTLKELGGQRKVLIAEKERYDSQKSYQYVQRIYKLEKNLAYLQIDIKDFEDTFYFLNYKSTLKRAESDSKITNSLLFFGEETIRYAKLNGKVLEVYFR